MQQMRLGLTQEEEAVLREVLESAFGKIRVEISNTDNSRYKGLLKDQERVIERRIDLLGKVGAEEVIGKPTTHSAHGGAYNRLQRRSTHAGTLDRQSQPLLFETRSGRSKSDRASSQGRSYPHCRA